MSDKIKRNKELVERFPFLLPRNRRTGEVPKDYDYSYTELDAMPDGWFKTFGVEMCEEIREELIKANCLEKYKILQIKEKFGTLKWYDFGSTPNISEKIIPKYNKLSIFTCIQCGKPADVITLDWICPYCKDCAKENIAKGNTVDVNEYYNEITESD